MNEAKREIEYLLFESRISNYRIFKETGISQTVLAKYSNGTSNIDNMTLGNAMKLHDYYLKIREKLK